MVFVDDMTEFKLKWKNLKENKCPKCDKDFTLGLTTIPFDLYGRRNQMLIHEWNGCGFKISERRYSEIVNNQITAGLEDKWNKEEGGEQDYGNGTNNANR